jgi:hypothetical protein
MLLEANKPTYPVTGEDSVKDRQTGQFRFTFNNIEPTKENVHNKA